MNTKIFTQSLRPEGLIVVQEDDSSFGLEIVSHVHSDLACDAPKGAPDRIRHPMHNKLGGESGKSLSAIKVKVVFDRPEQNIKARYEAWIETHEGSPICTGNGAKAVLLNPYDGTRTARVCKGPKLCGLVKDHGFQCSLQVRMDVLVEGEPYEVQSNSENTLQAFQSALAMAYARNGDLSQQELVLTVWRKSTRGSDYKAFTAMDLKLTDVIARDRRSDKTREGMNELATQIKENWNRAFETEFCDQLPDTTKLPFEIDSSRKPSRLEKEPPRGLVTFPLSPLSTSGEKRSIEDALQAVAT
ncbi:hypothetical protein [Comamonas testosteroni]|uniref:recombination directionality factor n=1 Tax=Comamonas testosteroni TaxID=285 RepID=UPI0012D2A52F|nr:hypothetical protein [Comamonas testosteroni]